jgi:cell division transport system ATP-binding protein
MGIVEFTDVTKTYGKPGSVAPALSNLEIDIAEGELVLLMGPSGAGKSTLIKLLLAMERPDCGSIRLAGRDVHRLTRGSIPFLRRNVGVVFQDFKLLPEATAHENVALAVDVLGLPRREVDTRVAAALEAVRLDPTVRRPVRTLSGGEQQRVALARALVGDPPILLADEPTGNLDQALTREILDHLLEINARGTTVVIATHDPVVRAYVRPTRLLYLERGRLVDDIVPHRLGRDDVPVTFGEALTRPEPSAGAPRERGSAEIPSRLEAVA